MKSFRSIAALPTSLAPEEVRKAIRIDGPFGTEPKSVRFNATGWHESLLRAYHIVEEVKDLCEKGTPPSVILKCIEAMEAA